MCLGVLGVVQEVWDEGGLGMARIDADDGRELIACLAYAPHADQGCDVLVHLGFVIEVLDPDEAAGARALRDELEAGLSAAPGIPEPSEALQAALEAVES